MPELITKGHAEMNGKPCAIMQGNKLYTAVVKSTSKSYVDIDYYDSDSYDGLSIYFNRSQLSDAARNVLANGNLYYTFELLSPSTVGCDTHQRRKDRTRGRNRYAVNAVRNVSWSSRWFVPCVFTHALYKQSLEIDDIDAMGAKQPRFIPWPNDESVPAVYRSVSRLGTYSTAARFQDYYYALLYPKYLRNHFGYLRDSDAHATLTIYLRVVLYNVSVKRFLPTVSRVLSYEIQ